MSVQLTGARGGLLLQYFFASYLYFFGFCTRERFVVHRISYITNDKRSHRTGRHVEDPKSVLSIAQIFVCAHCQALVSILQRKELNLCLQELPTISG